MRGNCEDNMRGITRDIVSGIMRGITRGITRAGDERGKQQVQRATATHNPYSPIDSPADLHL